MKELVTFIPRTLSECKSLLKELNDNRDGYALADRYGKIDVLNAEEIKALIALLEAQIGGPAAPAPEAPTESAPADGALKPAAEEAPAAESEVQQPKKPVSKKSAKK
jgi:hypothetical protein